MTIRRKLILIILPLIIYPLIGFLLVAVLSSRNGITNVATEFLSFKSRMLYNYMDSQWNLLANNDLSDNQDYLDTAHKAVADFSATLIDGTGELIFAIDQDENVAMASSPLDIAPEEIRTLVAQLDKGTSGWVEFAAGGTDQISEVFFFRPFGWYTIVAVEKKAFYGSITLMVIRVLILFLISMVVTVSMLILFAGYLTNPIKTIARAIHEIIETGDLAKKIPLLYHDEIGELGHYFNIMTDELDAANRQIKSFALKAVVSQRKEAKIRHIFQKYVPRNVIEQYYSEPESMLEGDNRVLGVLFSDIRSFTSFSEKLSPDVVVESLNKYFGMMVDVIMSHEGIVDKYIGDAIMAFFGAPVHHDNDAYQSVSAGLFMLEKLDDFNRWQRENGRDPFRIGVGINYGVVTIGNIGSDKKMDYTVIGDMVNLASRLEGLTKKYGESLIISESLFNKVKNDFPCRKLDRVVVKGKSRGVNIFSVKREITTEENRAWKLSEKGIELYYNREFSAAENYFEELLKILPEDYVGKSMLQRCGEYRTSPPPPDWRGDVILDEK